MGRVLGREQQPSWSGIVQQESEKIDGLPPILLDADAIRYYRDHPVEFVDDNIFACVRDMGHRDVRLSKDQKAILNSIRDYPRTAIESGHGTGKSAVLSFAGIWFLVTRFNTKGYLVKVPVIAPTYHQLYDVLWPEFKAWLPQSRLYPMFTIKNEELYISGHKDTMFIRARSPREPDNLQGFHGKHLLWLCDEAFGAQNPQSWETIEGSLTSGGDNRIVIAGQHTIIVGYCHDAFHADRAAWNCLRLSSIDSPFADKAYAERIERKYGRHSDVYRVRVLGQEPKGNPDAYIQLSRAEAARMRDVKPCGAMRMGCDSARFGDDLTVVTVAQGMHVFPQEILEKSDEVEIYELIKRTAEKYRKICRWNGKIECRMDVTGGYGAGAYDLLIRDKESGIQPIAINFSQGGDEEHADLTTRMWASLERQIDDLQLPPCDFLIEEIGTRRHSVDNKSGKLEIEPKWKYKKDYEASPDRSDSLVLCLFTEKWRKKVWEDFTRACMLPLQIGWENTKATQYYRHYGAIVMGADLSLSVLCALWDQRKAHLYVYDAFRTPEPSPVGLVPKIAVKMHLREFRIDRLVGNAMVFEDKGGKPIAKQINDALRDVGLGMHRIRPASKFDYYGSIVDVAQLFRLKQIVLAQNLEEVAEEWQYWSVDKGEPMDCPAYCEAICLIAGELKREKELWRVMVPIFRDYAKAEIVKKAYEEAAKEIKK